MAAAPPPSRTRYRFGGFTLSPGSRRLLRGSEELRLIPRYFDLLQMLVERRQSTALARGLLERASSPEIDWRTWSVARARARQTLDEAAPRLFGLALPEPPRAYP